MDTKLSKTNRRNWLAMILLPLALFLAGCDVKLVDLTPSSFKANPSRAYTVTAQIDVKNNAVLPETVRADIIIDGKVQQMTKAPGSESLYEYDYMMPAGRSQAAYYILVRYQRKTASSTVAKEINTEITKFSVEDRYSVELETNRAPVGTQIAILGRGFTREDKVLVGGTPAVTDFQSDTSLSFYVPSLPEGRNYSVKVLGLNGEMTAGTIRVDTSKIQVTHPPLDLTTGQSVPMTFTVPTAAPPGGLLITVTTDVPDSVIMPEVIIPAGQRSTMVRIQAGEPGSGNLFVEVDGFSEVSIPISVQ